MTDDDLLPPYPEGELIRQARDLAIPKLSIRAAAARIGMSPEQWGHNERGYRAPGRRRLPRASAAIIAKMASATRLITPAQLAEAGRADAARVLEEILRREGHAASPSPAATPELPERSRIILGLDPAARALVEPHLEDIGKLVGAAILRWQVPVPSGAQVFGDGTREAGIWDDLIAAGRNPLIGGFDVEELAGAMAIRRARDAAGREQGQAAGLALTRS